MQKDRRCDEPEAEANRSGPILQKSLGSAAAKESKDDHARETTQHHEVPANEADRGSQQESDRQSAREELRSVIEVPADTSGLHGSSRPEAAQRRQPGRPEPGRGIEDETADPPDQADGQKSAKHADALAEASVGPKSRIQPCSSSVCNRCTGRVELDQSANDTRRVWMPVPVAWSHRDLILNLDDHYGVIFLQSPG